MITELVEYPKSIDEALKIQEKWIKTYKSQNHPLLIKNIEEVHTVVGVDISFPKGNDPKWAIAGAVLWDLDKNEEIEHVFEEGPLLFPYKPGLLAFKEAPLICKALLKLSQKPDVILFDGHGVLHPLHFGEALHLGYAINMPSIGIAKNPFHIYVDHKNMEKKRGNRIELFDNGELLGYAAVLVDKQNPVFVSNGFGISLETSYEICLKCATQNKQPEPVHLADAYSRIEIQKALKSKNN